MDFGEIGGGNPGGEGVANIPDGYKNSPWAADGGDFMHFIGLKHAYYTAAISQKTGKIAAKPYISTVPAVFKLFAKQWFYE